MLDWWTGIGSRRAPAAVLSRCTALAIAIKNIRLNLRTGDATGCDFAFLTGYGGKIERLIEGCQIRIGPEGQISHCFKPIERYSGKGGWRVPALRACMDYGDDLTQRPISHRQLFLRNMSQVLGADGNQPSKFLVYWTPVSQSETLDRHCDTGGGSRYAVRRAFLSEIPCFHLAEKTDSEILEFARSVCV